MVHGVSFKGKNYGRTFEQFDYLMCPGPFLKRVYEESDTFQKDNSRLVLTGFPKVDAFFDGTLNRGALLKKYQLDPGRPIILYAPTWGEGNSMMAMGQDIIRTLQEFDANLIIKLHEHEAHERDRIRPLLNDRTLLVEESDGTPYLYIADILVSDASSVTNEFTLLDRPIVFVDVPELLTQYPDHRYDTGWGRRMGRVVHTSDDLREAIRHGLDNPSEHSEMRRQVAEDLFFAPGNAINTTAAQIYSFLNLEPSAVQK